MPESQKWKSILWGWTVIFLISGGTIAWGLLHMLIPEEVVTWDHGALEDTPAESVYGSDMIPPLPTRNTPPLLEPLPESAPLENDLGRYLP